MASATTAAPPRFRTVTGAGTIVALILVLAFGNTAYRDWVNNNTSANNAGGGAAYGLFVGWIVGLTTLAFRR